MRTDGVLSRVLGFAFACLVVGSVFGALVGAASAASPLGAYYTLTLKAWTESGHQTLRARVEVNYRKPNGLWVEYESHWTTDMIQVARDTRAYVYLREDPSGYAGRFLFWDNYGIARGPSGDRNWYLDMNGDRTIVATYRDISTPTLERGDYPDAQWIPAHGDHYTLANRQSIEYVVIHAMYGHFGDPNNPDASGTIQWFRLSLADRRKKDPNAGRSSAHYLISQGGKVVQMVREKDIAFHAGNEIYNRDSVGIELEDKQKYLEEPWANEKMYQASAKLVRYLTEKYNIPRDRSRIIGHSEVLPATGKKDPGPYWNWDYFMALVRGEQPIAQTLPFSGMYAVYEVERSWPDPLYGRITFRGTLKYTIDRVFGTFCDITYLERGSVYSDSRKIEDRALPPYQVSNFPTGRDTLLYLLPTTDPTKTTSIPIYDIMRNPPTPWLAPVPSKPVHFDYKGTNMIKVPLGSFNCYKLEGPSVYGNVPLYYDVNSKLLIYLYGKLELFEGKLEGKLSLKETNVKLTPQRCLIATATYCSELSPEVQFLRTFRDNMILSTFSGSSFIKVFNSWYYSFSPQVAQLVSESQFPKNAVKLSLHPLLGILTTAADVHSTLAFHPELATVMAGMLSSVLIGLTYLFPPMMLASALARKWRTLHLQRRLLGGFSSSTRKEL